MFPENHLSLAEDVLARCRKAGLKVAVAESCTGGLISGCLTAIPGSSDVLDRGFVTYANEAKTQMLGVPEHLIAKHGAVSEQVACAMAEGVLNMAGTDLSVAVTGVAGPDGGSDGKPVGLVHIAAARRDLETLHAQFIFSGARDQIRMQAVAAALGLLGQQAGNETAP